MMCRETKLIFTLLSVFVLCGLVGCSSEMAGGGAVDPKQGWQCLFNGKDLTGWDGDERYWSVVDGAIHAEVFEEGVPNHNTFLIWRDGKLKDFALKLKFRITNGNSGVQYRSKDLGNWRVTGYQAEVCNSDYNVKWASDAGFIYEEGGRRGHPASLGTFGFYDTGGGKKTIETFADGETLSKAGYYNEKDWNEYTIIALGSHITQFLNGYKTAELIDNDVKGGAREGILALQLHYGPPMVVEFKDIRVKHFDLSLDE